MQFTISWPSWFLPFILRWNSGRQGTTTYYQHLGVTTAWIQLTLYPIKRPSHPTILLSNLHGVQFPHRVGMCTILFDGQLLDVHILFALSESLLFMGSHIEVQYTYTRLCYPIGMGLTQLEIELIFYYVFIAQRWLNCLYPFHYIMRNC